MLKYLNVSVLFNFNSTYNFQDGNEKFPFFRYRATIKTPRPESYREDMELVMGIDNESEIIIPILF